MAKMNWSRARKYSGYEEKYERGTVMPNGRVVGGARCDLATKADELLAYRKPVAKGTTSAKDWAAIKAFVATAGLNTSTILGGSAGIRKVAAEIYHVPAIGNMAAAIRALPKKKRRALCKAYRKANALLSPKQKRQRRLAEENSDRMQAIREQLQERQ